MNEFGMPDFPGGFGRVQPLPPVPPPRRHDSGGGGGSSKPFLVLLLILACVMLGALLAWGIREHGERARLTIRNHDIEQSYVFVLAKRNNLASFLTDPKTRLYRLIGRGEAGGRSVTVAWQDEKRMGVLIGDRMPVLPDDKSYVLWLVNDKQTATAAGNFRPESAGTFYDFQIKDLTGGTTGFRVTLEDDPGAKSPSGPVVYESR